jgi:predicted ATPase/signal transduction histidine kinase
MINTQVIVPGYKVSKKLYDGSKTLVFRAFRETDQKPVVIKLLKNPYPSFTELVQFRNQYTIAKNLNYPGIIQTYSLEPFQNGYMLVMEDFGGISLKDYFTSAETLYIPSLEEFLQIGISLCDTLDFIYRHRVIHKDIKPANILINPETKQVKLIDFSIASLLPKETQEIKSPNVLEGTLAYISPEQTGRMNRGIDYRSDFYSLGVTFYQLLSGKLPFNSDDAMELVHCHIAKIPPSVNSHNLAFDCGNIPEVLGHIIQKLMAKNAEDRYQSALGLKHDLEFCLSQLKETGKNEDFEIAKLDICDRFIISEKLYGREKEVQELLNAFDRVAGISRSQPEADNEGKAELIIVAGLSGIGKTAVVNEVHKPIVKQRGHFIKGKFDQFNRNIPFSAFVQSFRDLMGQLLAESYSQVQQWQNKITEALGDNAQVIIDVIPELEIIIGQQQPAPELSASAAQNRFNLLFPKFLQLFTTKEHPLVIFLDDLQWADSASLKLIQLLMSQTDSKYLLLIGAYRDNEVSSSHPLTLALQEIRKSRAIINTITLNPLKLFDLNYLIANTLNCSPDLALPLTQLVYQKTKGNPFFANQFLKSLYDDGEINFYLEGGYWQCDITRIRELALTDNVVKFMALQLQKLPENTQAALKLAACIGNQFNLANLAIVSGTSQVETATNLWKALQEGLVIPTNEVYKFFQDEDKQENKNRELYNQQSPTYKFLHDRVQQAAYTLIPEDKRQSTHLKIGRLLLSSATPEEREDKIFDIVNQLNIGKNLITQQTERDEIAKLNLIAGEKAKAATAYIAAVEYLEIARELLEFNSWHTQYDLTLAVYETSAEVAYLNGDFEQMDKLGLILLSKAKTLLEQVKVAEIKIQMSVAQNQLLAAVEKGLEVLNLLGFYLPDSPSEVDIQRAFEKTSSLSAGREILDLINQPLMTAPEKLAILRILSSISAVSYIAIPSLYPLVILSQVDLSIQQGNAPSSAFAYASYGLILCGVLQDIESGYKFGKLALNLVEKLNATSIRAKVFLLFTGFVSHWKEHLNSTITTLHLGYESGLESGDLEFAAYCIYIRFLHLYFLGNELSLLEQEMATYSEVLTKMKQQTTLNWHQVYWQSVLNLIGDGENPCRLMGKAYNEETMLLVHQQAGERSAMFYLYFNKLILCYLFYDYSQAVENAAMAEQYLDGVVSLIVVPIFYFYDSLARLALYHDVLDSEKDFIIARVIANQEKMKTWADYAPMNHLHKFSLIEAERHRVLGEKIEAMEMYDCAISGAKENGYIQEEALASELAAKFYLQWGKEKIAQVYLTQAYYSYACWGAKVKVADLEKRYPKLLAIVIKQPSIGVNLSNTITNLASATVFSNTNSTSISDTLDLATVLKASQALSNDIKLSDLLSTLMQVVMENAGADKCALMLFKGNNLSVEATATLKEANTKIHSTLLQSIPVDFSPEIPGSIINYVSRTNETLVIDDAMTQTFLATDLYLQQQQPKSILCTPIINQGKLIGILYLENNLTTGVFTRERLEVIKLLTAQAAICLENAQLYRQLEEYSHTLEQKVEERTQELKQKTSQIESTLEKLYTTQTQLIQAEKMSGLGQLVAGIAHEINNPINFIYANLQPAREYVTSLIELNHLYQKNYPQPIQEIEEKIADMELDFLVNDLQNLLESMKIGADRIRQIVLSLRNFSRLDEAEIKPVDIHEGIDSTLLILQSRLKNSSKNTEISVIKEYSKLPLVNCSPSALNQVFMNILNNAIYALQELDVNYKPTITIRTEIQEPKYVSIRIIDNGMGMSESVRNKIFEPFFTTKPVGSGTGLGLSISYSIVVEQHGGELSCISSPGKGTEFVIEIPV